MRGHDSAPAQLSVATLAPDGHRFLHYGGRLLLHHLLYLMHPGLYLLFSLWRELKFDTALLLGIVDHALQSLDALALEIPQVIEQLRPMRLLHTAPFLDVVHGLVVEEVQADEVVNQHL